MTNKGKEILLKSIIVSLSLTITLCAIFSFFSERDKIYEILCFIFLIISTILGIIMYYLMDKIKITYKGISSEKLILKTETYEEFEKEFIEELYRNKYIELREIPNNLGCQMKYIISKEISINNIVLIVRIRELTEEVYNRYFEEALEYIANNEEYILKKDTNLIHIVCVNKVNDILRKITEQNVEQGYGRFNLPVGISFGSRTVYIAKQKGGFFIFRYKKLVKMFKKYINNQLTSPK